MLLSSALNLIQELTANGVQAVIAGGYARSLYHGVKPRDIDIIIMDKDLYKAVPILNRYGFVEREFEDYATEDLKRITVVWTHKQKLAPFINTEPSYDVDVIVNNSRMYHDVYDVIIHGVDVNMNQFVVSPSTGNIHGLGCNHDKVLRVITQDDMTPKRKQRLIEIAKEIGWDYSCLEETIA